jgi:hypothetical protein
MIKKSTLIVLLCAIALGGGVYYWQVRRAKELTTTTDKSNPAFSVVPSDIVSFSISHPGEADQRAINFKKENGAWRIVQPVETLADQPTVEGFVDQLTESRPTETEAVTPDRRKAFGLDPPQASVEFQARNGQKHTLLIGGKDFSGSDVYTIVDNQPKVSLLPLSLLTTAEKPLKDLRDMNVLHVDSENVSSFSLKNPSGDLAIARDTKDSTRWDFTTPEKVAADADTVDAMLNAVSSARISQIVSEKPDNLARYGLANPAIAFAAVTNDGQKAALTVGKKVGNEYYARDLSRPMIFEINMDLYAKLADSFAELRDKTVVHVDEASLNRIQLQNSNGTIEIGRQGTDAQWKIEAPASEKGKSASSWKILNPFTSLRADKLIDHPSSVQLAAVKNPAVTATLTKTSGKQITVRISKPIGDIAYAQSTDSVELFEIKKQTLEDLDLKLKDVAY